MGSNLLAGAWTNRYPYELKGALQRHRLFDPDYALTQDLDIYWKFHRDPVIAGAMLHRRHIVAGRDWFVEASGESREARRVAKIQERWLQQIEHFASARFGLAEAIFTGSKWCRIYGAPKTLAVEGAAPMAWWCVTSIRDQHKQRFALFRKDAPVNGNAPEWEWRVHVPLGERADWTPIDRSHYVRMVYDEAEDTLGYGRGLSEALYIPFWAKANIQEHGLQFLDRWAQGMIIAEVDALTDSATADNAATKADKYLVALEKMRARHIFTHDSRDKITVIDAPAGGWAAAQEAIAYYDSVMRALILGADLPSSISPGGAYASDQVKKDTVNEIIAYDRALMEEAIDRDVMDLMWRANKPNLVQLGLWDVEPGKFRLRAENTDDPAARATVIQAALSAGIPLRRDEVYAALGFTPPLDDDEVIDGKAQAPQPPGMPGGPPALSLGANYAAPFAEEKHPRESDGEFAPKGGGTPAGGGEKSAAKEPTAKAGSAAEKKPKRAPPGSQLHPDVLEKLRSLKVTKLPEAAIPADKIQVDLDSGGPALIKWVDRTGHGQTGFRPEFLLTNQAENFEVIKKLEPRFDAMKSDAIKKLAAELGGTRRHDAATVHAIIALTAIRPGGDMKPGSYGAVDLLGKHVTIAGGRAHLEFIGKEGQLNRADIDAPEVVAALEAAKARAGDEGEMFATTPHAANKFAVEGVRLKDYRTLTGTSTARASLVHLHPPPPLDADDKKAKKQLRGAILAVSKIVAERLNNTPSVARTSYIHPDVFREWVQKIGGDRAARLAFGG